MDHEKLSVLAIGDISKPGAASSSGTSSTVAIKREPGTNTFFWHCHGVNMGFEDWSHMHGRRNVTHGPGAPPTAPADRAIGMAQGRRLISAAEHSRCCALHMAPCCACLFCKDWSVLDNASRRVPASSEGLN